MRKSKTKISFFYKFLSSKFYLTEIPVENKRTKFIIWLFGRSVARDTLKIIRTGSCITLLSDFVPIEAKSFFRMLYFEDYVKYVFWTFNNNFILDLSRNILLIDDDNVALCLKVLRLYPMAYAEKLNIGLDEEVSYCFLKLASLQKDKKFDQMFALDLQNRKIVMELLEKRLIENEKGEENSMELSLMEPDVENHQPEGISFLEMLIPINGSSLETMEFIKQKTDEADFDFKIFSKISRLNNGKNPYGLNACIAAMIDFFYQHDYFKKEYSLEQIFKAYLQYSGNNIGKLKSFISEFRQDNSYLKHFAKLKKLGINKLK